MWFHDLEEILKISDLILVDGCFMGDATCNHLCDKLHQGKFFYPLLESSEEIFTEYQAFQFKNNLLFKSPKVFTVPGVIQEVKNFRSILDEIYQWNRFVYSVAKSPRYRGNNHLGSRYCNRQNKLTERIISLSRNEIDLEENRVVLGQLSNLIFEVSRTIDHLKIYSGPSIEIPRLVTKASDTDYALVGARMGYLKKNHRGRVNILSRDNDIPDIISAYELVIKCREMAKSSMVSNDYRYLNQ